MGDLERELNRTVKVLAGLLIACVLALIWATRHCS